MDDTRYFAMTRITPAYAGKSLQGIVLPLPGRITPAYAGKSYLYMLLEQLR